MPEQTNTTAIARPVRVIRELTAAELYIRDIDKARALRDAARARLDADFVARVEDARLRYLVLVPDSTTRNHESNSAPEAASAPA
jgi:hypothetical protein